MKYTVTIRNKNVTIEATMGKTILESILTQGIEFPHGCKSGNCGACKSNLHSGEIEMSPHSEYALSSEEKNRGLILPCRAVPWSDCEISIVTEDETIVHANRLLECKVVKLFQATQDIKIIEMNIISGGPYNFSAGQYAALTFETMPPRDYSMANTPGTNTLEFHARFLPDGAVTPHIQNCLKVGDKVKVQGPYGTAYFRENHKGPVIAVAGGSGLAPIKAILKTALNKGVQQHITFYFGVRADVDLYLDDDFNELSKLHKNFTFVPVIAEPSSKTHYRTGFLNDAIEQDFSNADGYKAYIAGPPIMVESVVKTLKNLGIQKEDCHADAFYTEAEKNIEG
jgi:CDP-4-dehydro-6-deoxyglucose reductase/ferredoxin-NAD(P)+ reductase (naphthalene dioxygenase ferredoxin-specific)